jgi:hypothetical protein
MNQPPKHIIDDGAAFFGLQIEYRDDLPPDNAGFLPPDDEPQYIAVNSNLPHYEQKFTIAHELGHYLNRHKRQHRIFFPALFDREYQSKLVSFLVSLIRRVVYLTFTEELEADIYAFFLLMVLGAFDDLEAYMKRHPIKTASVFFAMFCIGTPIIIKGICRRSSELLPWLGP